MKNSQTEYRLPLLYRFVQDQDFVDRKQMLDSLEVSLQNLLSDFIRNVKPVDIGELSLSDSVWCKALSNFIDENEPRLINTCARLINFGVSGKKTGVVHIEIAGKLCYDDSIFVTQLQH